MPACASGGSADGLSLTREPRVQGQLERPSRLTAHEMGNDVARDGVMASLARVLDQKDAEDFDRIATK